MKYKIDYDLNAPRAYAFGIYAKKKWYNKYTKLESFSTFENAYAQLLFISNRIKDSKIPYYMDTEK